MKNKIKLVAVAMLCVVALSCGNKGRSGAVVYESEDKKVKIYDSELKYELDKNLEASGLKEEEVPEAQLEQMKINIIQNLALTRAVALEGKSQNIDKNKKYKDGIENVKENLLAAVTVSERSAITDVPDTRIREVYEANKASFERKEDTVRLQLIITNDKAKADEALKEASAAPDKFADVVKKYTSVADQSNGETSEIPLSELAKSYEPINEAIKTVEAGKVVGSVVAVGNEFYVVKVLEKNPQGFVEFDKVKSQIKSQIIAQEKQQKSQSFIQEITAKYKIDQINKDKVKLTK